MMYCTKTENGVGLSVGQNIGPVEVKDYFSTVKVRRETSTKAPQKAAERRPDAAGEADFLEHCFIAKCILIGSSNYFTAGPKRSTSSFHEAMILAFVFRAL